MNLQVLYAHCFFTGEDTNDSGDETEEGYDSEEQDPAIEESIQNIIDAAATGDEAAVRYLPFIM